MIYLLLFLFNCFNIWNKEFCNFLSKFSIISQISIFVKYSIIDYRNQSVVNNFFELYKWNIKFDKAIHTTFYNIYIRMILCFFKKAIEWPNIIKLFKNFILITLLMILNNRILLFFQKYINFRKHALGQMYWKGIKCQININENWIFFNYF